MNHKRLFRIYREAKQMLESSDAGVDEISCSVGYEDPAAFRRIFRREVGVSPTEHRRRFTRLGMVAVGR